MGRCPTQGLGYNLPANTTDIGGEQKLWILFRKIGHAGQTFKMIVRGNKFDIVFSGAGVDDGIGKGELVRKCQICGHEGDIGTQGDDKTIVGKRDGIERLVFVGFAFDPLVQFVLTVVGTSNSAGSFM